jgi:hypothetical protein
MSRRLAEVQRSFEKTVPYFTRFSIATICSSLSQRLASTSVSVKLQYHMEKPTKTLAIRLLVAQLQAKKFFGRVLPPSITQKALTPIGQTQATATPCD